MIKAERNAKYLIRLNTGHSVTGGVADLQAAQTVQDWSLAISSIEAPPNGSSLFQDWTWKELGPFNLGTTLKAWKEIDSSLERVSGFGTYSATFYT